MKRLLLLALAAAGLGSLAILSCSPATGSSQYSYTYPGCASGGIVCPNDETLGCGLTDILNKNNDCTTEADCVASEVTNGCVAILTCDGPPAVNKDKKAAFEVAFNAEVNRYCAEPSCTSKSGCTPGPRRNVLVCFEGRCARAFRPLDAGTFPEDDGGFTPFDGGSDAGSNDAGATDAGEDAGFDAGFDAGIEADGGADAGDGGA